MGEGSIVRRAARGLAQTEGAQGHEEGSQEGHRQKAGSPKIGCEEISSQEIGCEEDEEKEVLILRSAPCARLEGWQQARIRSHGSRRARCAPHREATKNLPSAKKFRRPDCGPRQRIPGRLRR